MTAIPHAARALTSALGRFERASGRLLEAATGPGESDDIAEPLVEMMQAKHQAKASIATVRIADSMWQSLLNLQTGERRRVRAPPAWHASAD